MFGDGRCRYHDQITVDPILILRERGDRAHRVAGFETRDARPN